MPAREVEYQEFLERVYEETEDPEWHIRNYPGNETLQRLDEPFRVWVNLLHENLWLKQAGYIFERDELSVTDWKAMRIIENYHCRKMAESRRVMNQQTSKPSANPPMEGS